MTSDVELTAEFVALDAEKTEKPSVVLNGGTSAPWSGKYRLSYSCAYSLPKGYQLVKRGIILTNQPSATEDLDNFGLGATINCGKVATCAVAGTNAQFISNINNVAKGQVRIARAFLTYTDKDGNTETIYSSNCSSVEAK